MHRGAGYDADRFRRLMRQTRVRGQANSLHEEVATIAAPGNYSTAIT
jgi:alpha-ketoglutarate-dependent 2,4-dichlorophenoxyacetate dioxygenase